MAPVILITGLLLSSNLLVSALLGLGDAEALYYCYSRNLAFSYLDHPPLIGYLIRLSTALLGETVLGVRLTSAAMMAISLVATHRLTRDMFGDQAAKRVPLLMFAVPVFAIGLTAATPDAPLAALWPLYMRGLFVALREPDAPRWIRLRRGLVLGLLLGLCVLAKYTGALLVVTTLWLLIQRPHRRWLGRPETWMGACLALVMAMPILLWNLEHDWAGLHHRLTWTQQGAGVSFRNLGALIGGQLLYVGPLMLALFVSSVRRAIRRVRRRAALDSLPEQVLLAGALPALAAGIVLVLWSDVAEPHWTAAGYLALFPLAARDSLSIGDRLARWATLFGAAVFVGMHLLVLTPLVPFVTPRDRYEPKYDLANELMGWPELGDRIRALNPEGKPVTAAFYTQCAQLRFALNRSGDPSVHCVSDRVDDFDFWDRPFSLPDTGALFVDDNRFDFDAEALFPGAATRSEAVVTMERGGRTARVFRVLAVQPSHGPDSPQ